MWRRVYLLLLVVRVYFAASPSYLHPDEVFQGPEIIAGTLFPYPLHRTWEWTSERPIRSVFPLWLFYGLPMSLLKSLWTREDGLVDPAVLYYAIRLVMFMFSFVLEDWAIYELVPSPRWRKQAVLLVASSYVTWTFQTHSFSNSFETLLVLWSLVLIDRIVRHEHQRIRTGSCIVLGFSLVLGFFNRITFPAFLLIPGLRMLPHFAHRPLSLIVILLAIVFWAFVAVTTDTVFYIGPEANKSFRSLFNCLKERPVLTPYNNILYNTQTSNLAEHGIHPRYQHILVNLPQLLGPAMILLISAIPYCAGSKFKALLKNPRVTSAATGTLILSIMPHQEPRFLMPCIPLLLTCVQLPSSQRLRRCFWVVWTVFNALLGILMGIYHQGGVIPTQINIPSLAEISLINTQSWATHVEVFWWKTYPAPTYLTGANHVNPISSLPLDITTTTLMGLDFSALNERLSQNLPPCDPSLLNRITDTMSGAQQFQVLLAAPLSVWRSPAYAGRPPLLSNFTITLPYGPESLTDATALKLTHLYTHRQHINLDDMDFGDDGVWSTLERVIGRRGLAVWRVERNCEALG